MDEVDTFAPYDDKLLKEAPKLVSVLKEMKEGLDMVASKVQALTTRVKANNFPTADGISYLEAKNLLLLNYCQSLVYYVLRKAKGSSIEGHPVVCSLVEKRLFLEKIRPIDKKLQYQIQKLTRAAESAHDKPAPTEKKSGVAQENEDLLKYRPNPDMLYDNKPSSVSERDGVYRPPKFAPATMEENMTSKQQRNALRKEKEMLREARRNEYMKHMIDDLEGRPEEVREHIGAESRELSRYMEKMEERARQEEEQFTRAPLTKMEKKKMKHMKRSQNGLLGLTDSLYDEIKSMPLESGGPEESGGFEHSGFPNRAGKKRKMRC